MHSDRGAMPGSALFPFDSLDGAQMVLLFSGEVVPWSWSIWNDPRLADNELIVQLVRLLRTPFPRVNGEAAHRQLRGCVIWTHRAPACGGPSLMTGGLCFYVHRSPALVIRQSLSPCVLSSH